MIKLSQQQVNFFDELLNEKQFPDGSDDAKLRAEFAELSKRNGSEWIEKAMTLPKKDEGDQGASVPAPF